MIKLSDYVINFVKGLGVKHVFLLPGGGCMHLVDSLGKCKSLKYICCLHEQAVAIAADAYSQYTNNIGVGLVTTGPGGTNAITGVAASWIDSIPVLIISGQTKRPDMIKDSGLRQMGIQEVDIVSMIKHITKYAVTVIKPEDIRYHLEKAIYLATSGRKGPVWIDIPLDVQGAVIDEKKLFEYKCDEVCENIIDDKIAQVSKLLSLSKRPVIIAGNGIRLANAEKEFLSLMNKIQIPALTTWKAMDIVPENYRYYFGRPGSIGQRGANFILQNADCLISIGARLDLAQVGFDYGNFAKKAEKVIVDIDEKEITKMTDRGMIVDIPIVCDAAMFIAKISKQINKANNIRYEDWLKKCKNWKEKYPVILPEYYGKKKYVNTYILADVLSRLATNKDIIVPGSSGSCSEVLLQSFKVKKGQRILNSPGLGSMGFGLPAAIGACLASGNRRAISVIGDGGLQHNIQELETVKRLGLPLKIFVLNNNGYNSIRITQSKHFKGNYVCCGPESGLTLPDTCKIAKAYGIKTVRIHNQKRIKEKIRKIMDIKGPVICEVMVDPKFQTIPRLDSEVQPDGSIISKPIEDLFPFLSREEFAANMITK